MYKLLAVESFILHKVCSWQAKTRQGTECRLQIACQLKDTIESKNKEHFLPNQLTFDSGVWGPEGWLALTLASTSGRNIAALVPARILANVSVIMLNMQQRTGLYAGKDI